MSETVADIWQRIAPVLADSSFSVGASVEWHSWHLIGPNGPGTGATGPRLSPVYMDDFGRLWKERHVMGPGAGAHALICVLDLRTLGAAIDAPPTEVPHLGVVS